MLARADTGMLTTGRGEESLIAGVRKNAPRLGRPASLYRLDAIDNAARRVAGIGLVAAKRPFFCQCVEIAVRPLYDMAPSAAQ